MKKFLCFLTLFTLLFSLLSCQERPQDDAKEPEDEIPSAAVSHTPAELDTTDYASLCRSYFEGLSQAPASDFTYEIQGDSVKLLSYSGTAKKLTLPSSMEGKPVTALAANLFANAAQVSVLRIPDSVTNFDAGCLTGCKNLYALSLPLPEEENFFFGSLFGASSYETNNQADLRNLCFLQLTGKAVSVPSHCFYGCNGLVSILLPDSTETIGRLSFALCTGLKFVSLEKVKTVSEYAFFNAGALQIVSFSEKLESVGLSAFEGCDSLQRLTLPFLGASRTEHTYLSYIFGASTPEFSSGFYPKDLLALTLTDGAIELGNYALYECSALQSVSLPQTLQSIGVRAFSGCSALQSLVLPDALTSIRENAFFGCSSLKSVAFGNGLCELGINAFYNCSALEKLALPASLTALPNSAFAGCTALTEVDLCNLESVGEMAFRNCNAVVSVKANRTPRFEKGNDSVKKLLPRS